MAELLMQWLPFFLFLPDEPVKAVDAADDQVAGAAEVF